MAAYGKLPMVTPHEFTALNDIVERLGLITPEVICGIERKELLNLLPGEKTLAQLHNESTKKLFCLWRVLQGLEALEKAQQLTAMREEIETDHAERAQQAISLGEAAKALFWFEARSEAGLWRQKLGLRKGWWLVVPSADDSLTELLNRLISGE